MIDPTLARFDGDLILNAIGPDIADIFGNMKAELYADQCNMYLYVEFKDLQCNGDIVEKAKQLVHRNHIVIDVDVSPVSRHAFEIKDGLLLD